MPTGGIVVLKGNLAPDGALIKVAGLKSLALRRAARACSTPRKRAWTW